MTATLNPTDTLALIRERRSIRAFDPQRAIPQEEIGNLFEAARWAASSFNEQPWRFVYGTKDRPEAYDRLLSAVNENNRTWAQTAPMLVLAAAKRDFSTVERPNRHAWHDLGAAVNSLSLYATAAGIYLHQMAGILPDVAREKLNVPEGYDIVTIIAVGYPGPVEGIPEPLRAKENAPRSRKEHEAFVFEGQWP